MPLLTRKITAFLKRIADLPDRPSASYSAPQIKAQFDSSPEELRVALNGVVDDLTSTTPGASGSEQIGSAPITGVSGSTTYGQLSALKTLVDGATNQNAFTTVSVPGYSNVVADQISDVLTITGGTGISVSTNADTDTVTITATGTSLPGAHASTHVTGGLDVIPNAVPNGNAGLMSGADKAKLDSAITAAGGALTADLNFNNNNINGLKSLNLFYGTKVFEVNGTKTGLQAHADRFDVMTADGTGTILKADNAGTFQYKGANVLRDGGAGGTLTSGLTVSSGGLAVTSGGISLGGTALAQTRLNSGKFEYYDGSAWKSAGGSGGGIIASSTIQQTRGTRTLSTSGVANAQLLCKFVVPAPGEFVVTVNAYYTGTNSSTTVYVLANDVTKSVNATSIIDWRTTEGTNLAATVISSLANYAIPLTATTSTSGAVTTATMSISTTGPVYLIGYAAGSGSSVFLSTNVYYDVVSG